MPAYLLLTTVCVDGLLCILLAEETVDKIGDGALKGIIIIKINNVIHVSKNLLWQKKCGLIVCDVIGNYV